jgi:hypothetical protein
MKTTATRPNVMRHVALVGAVIAIALCARSAGAQTAKDVKGATPLVAVANEAPANPIAPARAVAINFLRMFFSSSYLPIYMNVRFRPDNCRSANLIQLEFAKLFS